jgi:hypothetical protein
MFWCPWMDPCPASVLTNYLQEEKAKSRKLEEELNRLKRAQGPGKSPLSPR